VKHVFGCLALLAAAGPALAADALTVNVTGGKNDLQTVIVSVPVPEKTLAAGAVVVTGTEPEIIPAQVAPAGGPAATQPRVVFVLPVLKAGETRAMQIRPSRRTTSGQSFAWTEGNGHAKDLVRRENGKDVRVLSYVNVRFDPKATPPGKTPLENPTIKPYHHAFDPSTGTVQLTNGPLGQYPHHRGIYFGFNKITHDGKKADVWHCRNGESTVAGEPQLALGGPLFGLHRFPVAWNGRDGKTFATELRQLTAFHFPHGTLIDFTSELRTDLADGVKLDGDPQHAGFHFRANSAMEKNTKETYFLRPDGKGEPGKEINWDPKTKKGPVNLPWDAMSYVLDGKRYTVLYLDHPDNPKEARQSERCYGRIGTYFEYHLTPDKPLTVRYRLWIQEGEMTADQCAALSHAFTDPVKVAVK